TLPVFPQNPDGSKPNPGGNGSLTIDFASSFDFGNHKISNKDQTYLAKAQKYFDSEVLTPNYVQVTDRRGTFAGWNLKV
ncbi:WxL domain-containing protein, partial [Salmonella enterica]